MRVICFGKMSSKANLRKFLQALENVKQDYTCGFCSKLCQNAVTLSKCFHTFCSEHFEGLKNCPTCNVPVDGCKTYTDPDWESAVAATKKLDDIFKPFQQDEKAHSSLDSDAPSVTKFDEKQQKKKDIPKKQEKLPIQVAKKGKNSDLKQSITKVNASKLSDDKSTKLNDGNQDKEKPASAKKVNKSHSNQAGTKTSKHADSESTNELKQKVPRKLTADNDNLNASYLSNLSSAKLNKTLEKRNKKGETALHIACRVGDLDKVVKLLNQGANTNTKDHAGWTPLHEVVQNGRLDLVKILLQHNALINVPGQSNETPLHEAIRYGHEDIVKELVTHGADTNIRNIKGETPAELAKGNLKEALESAAENIIHTQSVNVTHISKFHSELDYDDIEVYCVSQSHTVQTMLKTLIKSHENLHIEVKFTKNVTHLIVDTEDQLICTSTLDVLQAITNELWIISSEWIIDSTGEKLEPFEKYEVRGVGKDTYNGPKNARYNKYKQLPRLFNGCHFYLHNFNTKYEISKHIILNKTMLAKLITDAGGKVLRRVPNPELIPDAEKLVPYHARKDGMLVDCSHYIIFKDMYEPKYNMKHLKALPVGWLIECIEKYELCDP